MKKYIHSFNLINESVKHNGIVLIKGKPKGKDQEQTLYASHVSSCAEVRPGAMMLFLSDQFYRIRKDGKKLKGARINWKDEDSLKDAINSKSPGKLSIVRNKNKTPYHWKTLKHTNITDALNAVDQDLMGDQYLFESSDSSLPIEERVVIDALDSIFKDGPEVIVLDWEIPDDSLSDSIDSDSFQTSGSEEIEWTASFDCLHVGRPELDDQLKEKGLRRFEVTIYFTSTINFTQWYDPGDYNNPPEGGIEVESISTEISDIHLLGSDYTEFEESFGIDPVVSKLDTEDLESLIKKKHVKFI